MGSKIGGVGLGKPPPPPLDTTGYGQRAGGMHPTGMHCYISSSDCAWNRVFNNTQSWQFYCIIANFVLPYIRSFLFYLHRMMLLNVKLDVNWYKRITFQGCRLQWSTCSSFLMAKKLTILFKLSRHSSI